MKDLYKASQKHEKLFAENGVFMDGFEKKLEKIEGLMVDVGHSMKNITENMDYLMRKVTDHGPGSSENNRGKGPMDESGSHLYTSSCESSVQQSKCSPQSAEQQPHCETQISDHRTGPGRLILLSK